jgi:biopolymer transport protein ExbB/TolQ
MAIIQAFNEGGFFMYFILLFGILTFALITERAGALFIKMKLAPANFRHEIVSYLSRADFKGAEAYAKSGANAKTSVGKITAIGCHLRASAAGDEEVQARMDEALSAELSLIDRRTGFLAMFGNVATLLGLLGTITGMIHSFAGVASANPADRATLLSKGISEAMNCTAFGLIVAIPALVAFAVFQNRTDRIVSEITEATSRIYHDLLFLTESEAGAASVAQSSAAKYSAQTTAAPTMTV